MSEGYVVRAVVSVLRYPVKSMMGEELTVADVTQGGLFGDRAYALIDNTTDKIASAKNPRKWARLFECHASFVEPPTQRPFHASGADHAAGWQQPKKR